MAMFLLHFEMCCITGPVHLKQDIVILGKVQRGERRSKV